MQAQELITLRKAKRLTQQQLATLAAMNRSTLAQYESGKLHLLPADKLYRLAQALDLTMETLYRRLYLHRAEEDSPHAPDH